LLAIGEDETCVCHLEAAFGWRQAYLSQHLMALRETGLVLARREGRFIHYRLADPALLEIIRRTALLKSITLPQLSPSPDCGCPNCSKERSLACS
jgi:ArsR family transcriptional regulator